MHQRSNVPADRDTFELLVDALDPEVAGKVRFEDFSSEAEYAVQASRGFHAGKQKARRWRKGSAAVHRQERETELPRVHRLCARRPSEGPRESDQRGGARSARGAGLHGSSTRHI
jgi:hypothetical protein